MRSEAAQHADFSGIRYAQCWEDADILVEALNVAPGKSVVSIGSAGDNTFSLVSRAPKKVYVLDLSPAQLACVDFRKGAYEVLDYEQFLELLGIKANAHRLDLYQKIRASLAPETIVFWDERKQWIERGIVHEGKFERYFEMFRTRVLPIVHRQKTIDALLLERDRAAREQFYERKWNTLRWRLMFQIFFSRFVMGRFGRDPSFFRYVEGSVASEISKRVRRALTDGEPSRNPYLHWILKGEFGAVLPHALREQQFAAIKQNVHAVELRLQSLEDFLEQSESKSLDAFNLSDIFEYMSEQETHRLFHLLLASSRQGARIAYWNMMAPRSAPNQLAPQVKHLETLSQALFTQDKAFFYRDFRVEEVTV